MAKQNITDIVTSLLDGVGSISKSETIIGQPQSAGAATVIPIHRLKVAFGAGSVQAGAHAKQVDGDSGVAGAGGAVELDPIAAIAVSEDGHAHLLTVEADSGSTWAHLLAEVPDIITKVARVIGDRSGGESSSEVAGKPASKPAQLRENGDE